MFLQELHHCSWRDHRAVDGNGDTRITDKALHPQTVCHPADEKGLPHARAGGAHNPHTQAVKLTEDKERLKFQESYELQVDGASYFSWSTQAAFSPNPYWVDGASSEIPRL